MDHLPVLLHETINSFRQCQRPLQTLMDGTFGRGGHTRAILKAFPGIRVWALDQDEEAVHYGQADLLQEIQSGHLVLAHGSFSEFAEKFEQKTFDGILLDLGVSSPQLDQAERGFSFYNDGPLDMRMNRQQQLTASEIVNSWSEKDLTTLFSTLGEIRNPYRVVRAIVEDRRKVQFTRTRQLASLIERVCGWSHRGFHPATPYFLALRLKVNQELEVLGEALPRMLKSLNDRGRAVVITFHSLEDRIVKNIFKSSPDLGHPVGKKVIKPTCEEIKTNPRSRSAKLRVFERGVL